MGCYATGNMWNLIIGCFIITSLFLRNEPELEMRGKILMYFGLICICYFIFPKIYENIIVTRGILRK